MTRNRVFVKLTQWEHWPTLLFYIPLLPFFLWRSIVARHPIFYTIANPGMLYSGNGTESKFASLALLPPEHRPESLLLTRDVQVDNLQNQLDQKHLTFPLIAKPDIGFRGYLVKKIDDLETLQKYVKMIRDDVIVQEFIPYENELGIFYHREPGQNQGKITSVTIKKFIRLTGDGKRTLSQLIEDDDRAYLYMDLFSSMHRENMGDILPKDKRFTLSVIGNHSKGTQFINGNHLINEEMERLMDHICRGIKGWYYGRLDIKFESMDKLLQGKNFKILEINGIISEPTHIYDATHETASYFNALKCINKHWNLMAGIATKLHREHHIPYPDILPYCKNMLWLRSHTRKLKKLNAKGLE
jgi:hypothetical protein